MLEALNSLANGVGGPLWVIFNNSNCFPDSMVCG